MKNQRTLTIAATVVLTALAAFAVFRFSSPTAQAFNPQPDPPGFGMLGITQGQSIRVNVVNTAAPDPNIPPDPVRVVVNFRNADGELLRNNEGQVIRRVVLLNAGQSTSLDLNGDNFGRLADAFGRIQIRPVVQIQRPDGSNGIPPDPVIPSIEIFNNNNGRTQFSAQFVPAVQRAATPQ